MRLRKGVGVVALFAGRLLTIPAHDANSTSS